MTTTTLNIETLLNWSAAKRVETRNGPRDLRTASPNESFWSAWRAGKDALKAAGVGVGTNRVTGAWEACWWKQIDAAEQAAKVQAVEASRATDADVNLPCPDGLAYLPFQRAGISYCLSRPNVLIGDEQGLGKTIQAIGLFNSDPTIKRVLIVCPASLRLNWKKEFTKWAARPVNVFVVNGGNPAKDMPPMDEMDDYNVLIVNYDVLEKHRVRLHIGSWDLLIADEVQRCKNPKTLRTQALFGKKDKKGNVTKAALPARRKLFLSGTPIVNRPLELWPLLESLDPEGLGKNFFKFAIRYCAARQELFGWDFSGSSNLDELQRRMREKFLVRRLKCDVLTELPAKQRQVVEIPANGASKAVAEERRIYEGHQAYIEELEARLEGAEGVVGMVQDCPETIPLCDGSNEDAPLDPTAPYAPGNAGLPRERFTRGHRRKYGELAPMVPSDVELDSIRRELASRRSVAFTEMSKARHEVALAKVPHVIEHLEAALEEGAVVCFAHHRDVVAALATAFPGRTVTLTGDTSMEDRQRAVEDFQAGKADLFIGNIQAAGVGITLTRSAHVVFAELDWVPGNLSQAEDRCHRIGQTASVLVQHLVLEGSMDADMARKVTAKQAVIDRALDARTATPAVIVSPETVQVPAEKLAEVQAKADAKRAEEQAMTDAQREAIHLALRMLTGVCDGACKLDGQGFNRYDTGIGHSLASQATLSPRQALLGRKLAVKYQKQIGSELLAACKGEQP